MPSVVEPQPSRDLGELAPQFRRAVKAALSDCHLDGIDAMVFEAHRSAELQALYYARGRTKIPPARTVTNARSNLYSWHGYGLAVDVISQAHYWSPPEPQWWARMATIFKRHGCDWGGDWRQVDLPHIQYGTLKASPSDLARKLLASGGVEAVWRAVGAA